MLAHKKVHIQSTVQEECMQHYKNPYACEMIWIPLTLSGTYPTWVNTSFFLGSPHCGNGNVGGGVFNLWYFNEK